MRTKVFLATLCLFCNLCSLSCAAQAVAQAGKSAHGKQMDSSESSKTFRVGLKSILVPQPADLHETGPDFRVLFEHDAPDSNRLIAAFLPQEAIARLPERTQSGLAHYAMLETLRRAEFTEVDEDSFKQVVTAVAQQFGTDAKTPPLDVKTFQDEVNHKLKAIGGTAVTLDKPVPLGEFFLKPNASGFGMLMDVGADGKTVKVVIGMTVLRVQNRLLYAAVFAHYTGDDSATWVRTTSEQWADAILKANSQ